MSSSSKNTYLAPKYMENPPRFPNISQPKIVGSFSLDEKRQYLPDTRNCKYVYKHYQSDRIEFNLNDGINNVVRKPESCVDEKLTHILQFIVRNKQKLTKMPTNTDCHGFLSADIVCFRGLLRLIMCTPYEHRDGWIILASKYKGTIYLCAQDTDKQIREKANRTDETKRILSYGFKFEQFILTDDPLTKPITNVPVNECDEFCCMFSTTLNGQKILYGAEMDGIEGDRLDLDSADLNQCSFVELKAKLREQNHRQKQNLHRFKMRNWWCQSFLVNIQKIIVGTRSSDGIVNELSTLNVRDIPKLCQTYWSSSVCMEFCSQFLKLIAKELKDVDSPYDVYRFEYDPLESDHIYMKTYQKQNDFSFLPEWFIKETEHSMG